MQNIWANDALEFRPKQSPFMFVAFHAGPRICLGRDFSYRQMKILPVALLYLFQFKLADEKTAGGYRPMLTLATEIVSILHQSVQAVIGSDYWQLQTLVKMGILKATVIHLFLSLLLLQVVLSKSDDGFVRVVLKKHKFDRNNRIASHLWSKKTGTLRNSLNQYLLGNFGDLGEIVIDNIVELYTEYGSYQANYTN